jgi:hypothetical protein
LSEKQKSIRRYRQSEKEFDRLVYLLYNLNEEEMGIMKEWRIICI